MEIHKEFRFESAHRLPFVPDGHKCQRLHGHSFRVQVSVSGPLQQPQGWIMDFDAIRTAFEPLRLQLDHNYLNEVDGLENPTSENLAVWIWQRLKPNLAELSSVHVMETCTSGCIYRGEDV